MERRNTDEELAVLATHQTRRHRRTLAVLVSAGVLVTGLVVAGVSVVGEARQDEPVPVALSEPAPDAGSPKSAARKPRPPTPTASRDIATLADTSAPISHATPRFRTARMTPTQGARALADQKKGAIQQCYERELKRTPRLRGTVTVEVDLSVPNRVSAVRVKDTLRRGSFTACVTKTMRRLDVPPLDEDLTLELPFALKSPEL